MTLTGSARVAAIQQQQAARRVAPTPPATAHVLGCDVSNFTSPLTPQALELWKQDGIGLVIVQAFPPNYAQHKQQLEQMAQCFAAGLAVEAYIYDYLTAPDWRDACLAGLRGLHVTRVWADEEDVTPEAKALQLYQRIGAVRDTLEAIEQAGYQTGVYCLTPEARILTADLEWVPAGDLRVGTPIVGFDEELTPMNDARRRRGRRWQPAIVTGYQRRKEPVFQLEFGDGRSLYATGEHRWIVTQGQGGRMKPLKWRRTDELARRRGAVVLPRYLHPWQQDLGDYWAGFMAAAFDSEGCLTSSKRNPAPRLAFAQRSNQLLAAVRNALSARGFQSGIESIGKSGVHNVRIVGGLSEQLRFLGQMRPPRLLNNWANMLFEGGFQMEMRAIDFVPLAAIRYVGEREIAAFSSSSGTYIAEGFGAHNTGSWWWGPYMNDTTIFQEYPLWVAFYDGVPDVSVFTPFGGWTSAAMKQFAGTTVLHGVTGVDLDVT